MRSTAKRAANADGRGKGARTLRLAARYADWWNADWTPADKYRELSEQLTAACGMVDRDPTTIRRTWLGLCSCARTLEAAHEALLGGHAEGNPGNGLVGTPAQIVDGLEPFVEAGLDHWIMATPRVPDQATLDLLIDELLPRLRARYG
jgi:alkanesulfonate monooxygenase SsuD/methylene tetrahydromethanopterin reductase-like flavin-dependent oxidoreductase (luciferase family)